MANGETLNTVGVSDVILKTSNGVEKHKIYERFDLVL